MPKTIKSLVVKVEGGYQVHTIDDSHSNFKPVNDKVYFHPTSAYAAMGRLVHTENVKALGLTTDPAKAPLPVKDAK